MARLACNLSGTLQPHALLAWYRRHRRAMPWRGHPDPYAVWVSEIMLQQTQVDTVRPYFERFLRRFPTAAALAAAPLQDVLKRWEGLGYYSRARHLHAAARTVMAAHAGCLPRTAETLAALPGIGPYTAAAIASICFGEHVPVVDGNVARVFARLLGWRDDFRQSAPRRKLAAWLTPHIAAVPCPGDFNQAMMELGALVCTPRKPACARCPLSGICHACRTGTQADFPVRSSRKAVPLRRAVAVVIRRRGRVLLVRRAEAGLLGGFWELPGGDVSGVPSPRTAAAAVRRQTGLDLSDVSAIGDLTHVFSHFRLRLAVYTCRQAIGRVRRNPETPLRWATACDLDRLPMATAHRRALALGACRT